MKCKKDIIFARRKLLGDVQREIKTMTGIRLPFIYVPIWRIIESCERKFEVDLDGEKGRKSTLDW